VKDEPKRDSLLRGFLLGGLGLKLKVEADTDHAVA